jgi:glucose-specific phosphotransferase system IIA component
MFEKLFGKGKNTEPTTELKAYVTGKSIALADVPDQVFSAGILGEGMAIEPTSEVVVAPAAGEICTVADTKHACGIQLNNGIQLLIHIGIDTVAMNGNGFTVHVKAGEKVEQGQKLITFSRQAIKEAGYPDVVVLVLTENDRELNLDFQTYGQVSANESTILKFEQ